MERKQNVFSTYRYIVFLACCSNDLTKRTSSEEFSNLEVSEIS